MPRPSAWLLVSALAAACGSEPPSRPPTPIAAAPPAIEAPRPEASRSLAPETPRYDLRADEARGGHTIERHVGRTDDQLRDRLRREPNISAASTYTDLTTAETVIARAFAEDDDEVAAWRARRGSRPNLVIDRTEPAPIGRSLRRNQREAAPCNRALVVVRWDVREDEAFVLTSYPECRR